MILSYSTRGVKKCTLPIPYPAGAYPKGSVPVEEQSEFCHQVQDIVLVEHVPILSESLNQLRDETAKD